MPNGTIERKCMKAHNKAEGRCSPRCVRWYPRVQRAAPDGHGRRRFDYLGGYPTKARTGELCALEWHDLDPEEGTLRFRQALSSIDQQLATGRSRPDGARGKLLVVGPLKTAASQAILSLPAFAVHALRDYQQAQRQRTRAPLRLLLVRPGQAPGPSNSTCCRAPSATARCGRSMPAGHSGPSPKPPASRPIRICCGTRWPRRWRRPRSRPA